MASAIMRQLTTAARQFSLGRQSRVVGRVVELAGKVTAAKQALKEIELMPVGTRSSLATKQLSPLKREKLRSPLLNVASSILAVVGAVLKDTMPAH